jgi:hypothetical protein
MAGGGIRLRVTLDQEHAAKLAILAERTHVPRGALARLLLSHAIGQADVDPVDVVQTLDGTPGAFDRAQLGFEQTRSGLTIELDAL